MQAVKTSQVVTIRSTDFDNMGENYKQMLHGLDPNNFATAQEWFNNGVRVVLCTPAMQTGVNGLDMIKDLVLYSVPKKQLPQLVARFDRPSRYILGLKYLATH